VLPESSLITQVAKNSNKILRQISMEEEKFLGTIGGGESVLNKMISKAKANSSVLSGADAFLMYDTHGFPLDLTKEVAEGEGLKVDDAGFEAAMKEQKQRSKVCRSAAVWVPNSARFRCLLTPWLCAPKGEVPLLTGLVLVLQ
jgi:alanyl-tRNA synthetase